jgi:hypothetical protein
MCNAAGKGCSRTHPALPIHGLALNLTIAEWRVSDEMRDVGHVCTGAPELKAETQTAPKNHEQALADAQSKHGPSPRLVVR